MSTTTTTTATATLEAEQPQQNGSNGKSDFFEEVHFLGDADGKIVIRSPPKFTNPLDERKYQKEHLAAAFRVFARQGFDEGVAGHISLRDPINPRECLATMPENPKIKTSIYYPYRLRHSNNPSNPDREYKS